MMKRYSIQLNALTICILAAAFLNCTVALGFGMSAFPQSTSLGASGDGKPDFSYNPTTGDLRFQLDGASITTTQGDPSFVAALIIMSAGGNFLPDNVSDAINLGKGATFTPNLLTSALTNSPGFYDGFDIGNVLPPNLLPTGLSSDLTVKYQVSDGGTLKPADIADVVFAAPAPEPTTMLMLTVSAGGSLVRRRSRAVRGAVGRNAKHQ
jgi:hypothetical protein